MIMGRERRFNSVFLGIIGRQAKSGDIGRRHDDYHGQAGRGITDYSNALPQVRIGYVQDGLPLPYAKARLEYMR